MENTKISVIIPNYNSSKTLKACIESCLNQTLKPLEILVCDDGSTDNSKEIVEQINNECVKWIPLEHSGTPAVPRNNGMKICKGEWIAFCDSDDEWLPNKLEKQMAKIKEFGCKAVCTNAFVKINNNITSKKVSNFQRKVISFKNLLRSNDIVCSSVIIHKSIFNKINGFSKIVEHGSFADYIYWLRVSTETDFAFVNEPLVIYDDHPETSIRALFTDGKLLKEKTLDNFTKWIKEQKNIKSYYFVLQLKKYLLKEWVKRKLRYIIKLCYKR